MIFKVLFVTLSPPLLFSPATLSSATATARRTLDFVCATIVALENVKSSFYNADSTKQNTTYHRQKHNIIINNIAPARGVAVKEEDLLSIGSCVVV